MTNQRETLALECRQILDDWLESCKFRGKLSRNTIGIGIVVLDHFRETCPVSKKSVISERGEVRGARAGGFKQRLTKYNIPKNFLKEITTRQAHQDGQRLFEAFQWGNMFAGLCDTERDSLVLELIAPLLALVKAWLERKNLEINIDRRQSPTAWLELIVGNAKKRSGGVVEQHLVGAKLERRFASLEIPNYPAHAGDVQTTRDGDFVVSNIVYHVTATPGQDVIQKCAANLQAGKYPILLVPTSQVTKAKTLAEIQKIEKEIFVASIEEFVALNIVELAAEEHKDFFAILQEIVNIYNERLEKVETDLSLRIDIS